MNDIKTLKALKNKILSLAMQGKLVKQNENDEPASILLEKIRQEKQNQLENNKKGKGKSKEKPLPPISAEEVPYELPKSWQWVRLGEVCAINPTNQLDDNDEVTFLPMKYVPSNLDILREMEHKQWKDIKKQYNHFAENDVLLAKITPCFENRKSCIARNIFSAYGAGSTELYVFRCLLFLPQYLLYFFNIDEFINNCIHNMTGTAGQKRVPLHYIIGYFFPLPPLAEQERIVAKIEEIFAIIDEVEKNISENKKISKVLYNKILSLAMQGKLVKQNENDEPASVLLEKIRQEKQNQLENNKKGKGKSKEKLLPPIGAEEVPYELPKSWQWVRLGEVCEIIRGNGLTKKDFTEVGVPCIHYGQIHKYFNHFATKTLTYTSEILASKLKNVEYGNLIMVITSENLEDVCKSIAWLGHETIVTGSHTVIIKHIFNPLYLVYLFESNVFQKQKNNIGKGMKVIEVSSEILKTLLIPIPPLAEQERIVAKIEEIKEIIDDMG